MTESTPWQSTVMTLSEQSMRELAQLSGVVLGQQDLPGTLEDITEIALKVLPVLDGASITTYDQGRPSTVAASSDWARSLDELQYEEHEGPCLDCWRMGTVFRSRDLAGDTRWPSYGPRAAGLGARSSVSLPLSADGQVVGALNLYAREPDSLDASVVSMGEVIAAHAGLAYQVATAFFGQRDLAAQLREAIHSRAVIEQAKGILMFQRKITAEAAFEELKALSQHRNVKLNEIAQRVVETGTAEDGTP